MATSRLNQLPAGWGWIMPATGLLAGLAMALAWSLGSALRGLGPWLPWNMLGATSLTGLAATSFSGQTGMGLILHLMVSVCLGVIASVVLTLFFPQALISWPRALGAGLVAGSFIYVVMGRLIGPVLNPGITAVIPGAYVLGHLIFGAVVGLSLWALLRMPIRSVAWAPEPSDRLAPSHESEEALRR